MEFALEKDEARRLIARQLWTRRQWLVIFLSPLVLALLVNGTGDIGVLLSTLGLCYLFIPLFYWLTIARASRQVGPGIRANRRYTPTSEQLSKAHNGATGTHRWFLYSGVTETKRFLVIHIRDAKGIVGIPKRIFQTPEECGELRDSVRSWIVAASVAQ